MESKDGAKRKLMIKSKVLQELGSITDNCLNTVATVGMTSRKSVEFAVFTEEKGIRI
ncbi:hypothetical protein GCM10020331_052800 [Ectobacillus funiculus]